MSMLRSIEERLSRVVEGAFGKAFRTSVQPVELARRLVREMDDHQSPSLRKVYVPNVYQLYLAPRDMEQFDGYERALKSELEEYLAEHARRNGYSILARPRVDLLVDEDLDVGAFGIATEMVEPPEQERTPVAGGTEVMPAAALAEMIGTWTLIGLKDRHSVTGTKTTLGRGRSNDIVLNDASVSRNHAEIVQRGAMLVLRDLGSTNGVLANDVRVTEHVLSPGDRLLLGNVQLKVERN
jgi:hypothetical protein